MADIEQLLEKIDCRLDKMDIKVTEIRTVLLGVPDTENGGLYGKVKGQDKSIQKLFSDNKKIWIILTILSTSIGGGAYGIVKALVG